MATPQFSPDEVPQYHRLMIFLLRIAEDGQIHRVVDIVDRVASQLGLTAEAKASTLPDGRNTHLIQQGAEWWEKTLSEFFAVGKITIAGNELHVVVGAKKKPAPPTPEAIALEAQRLAA